MTTPTKAWFAVTTKISRAITTHVIVFSLCGSKCKPRYIKTFITNKTLIRLTSVNVFNQSRRKINYHFTSRWQKAAHKSDLGRHVQKCSTMYYFGVSTLTLSDSVTIWILIFNWGFHRVSVGLASRESSIMIKLWDSDSHKFIFLRSVPYINSKPEAALPNCIRNNKQWISERME